MKLQYFYVHNRRLCITFTRDVRSYLFFFSAPLCKSRKARIGFVMSVRPSVCRHESDRLPMDVTYVCEIWRWVLKKSCRENSNFDKWDTNIGHLTWRLNCSCACTLLTEIRNTLQCDMSTLRVLHCFVLLGVDVRFNNTHKNHCCFFMTTVFTERATMPLFFI
jgi:hypothetical protein